MRRHPWNSVQTGRAGASLCSMIFLLGTLSLPVQAEELTREKLLEGCPIPQKREFPLSQTVAPCTDFYKYVCEPVASSFKLPPDKSKWNFSFTDLDEKILYARKNYLAHFKTFVPKSQQGKSLRNFYLSCMNESASAKEEKKIVQDLLNGVANLKTREALVEHIADQIDKPYFSFLNYGTDADQDDPTKSAILLLASATTFPEKSYYTKEANLKALQEVLTEFFSAIGFENPSKHAKNVVHFEHEYSKQDLSSAEYREQFATRNTVPRKQTLKDYPLLKLDRFYSKIPSETPIRIIAPKTIQFIHSALQNQPLEVLKDVYTFHLVHEFLDDAYPGFFKKWFKFKHDNLGGPEKRRPRDERCSEEIKHKFAKELDTELISILFKNFPDQKVDALVSKIRTSLASQLTQNQWLSPAAKKEALRKIQSAKLYLVKPKTDREWDYNPAGNYSETSPYENRIQLRKLLIAKELKELFEPRNRERWYMGPLTLNAYYVAEDNKFTLLQGILQYPFFDENSTEAENLAAIGTVTGHELGHGIDDQGSKYDADGKFNSWLTEKDLKSFRERSSKFVDQMNKIGHDGKLTLGETIGDHVGLRTAYLTAFDEKHPGTPAEKQKFFISYARLWCNKVLPKMEERLLKTDPHPLGYARVNQQVVQADGFYEAFSCKKGDPMYLEPENRIRVW